MKNIADLFQYQRAAIDFIQQRDNCALFVEMGLGKTVTTLSAIVRLKNSFDVHKVLVIGPLRVARKVWSDEVDEWTHLKHLRVSIVCGTASQRLAAIEVDADVYCINRENVPWLCQRFVIREKGRLKQINQWPWDTVVIDESDSFKSQSSQRWKWMRRVRRLFTRMILLTGTPVPHSYRDLWSQIFLLDGGQRLGTTETSFKERWMDPPGYGQIQWTMKEHAEKEIKERLKDIVLSLRAEDYLDLPPILYNFIKVQLPKAAQDKYNEMERKFITEIVTDKVITAVNGGVLSGKLLQMAGGAVYEAEGLWVRLHDEKIKALSELLIDISGPILVAYTFQHELTRIKEMLQHTQKKSYRMLQSKQDEDDWNAGKIDILLLHPMSGGHGLNLQHSGSETIIWFGPTFNRGHYDQLNARLAGGHRRMGKNIVVHHLIAEGTIDMFDALPSLERKGDAQERLLKLLAERVEKILK